MGPRVSAVLTDRPNPLRDDPVPAVMGMSLPFKARLASHVGMVNPGTPLVPAGHGVWDVDPTGTSAEMVAGVFGVGGDTVQAYRSVTLELYARPQLSGFPEFTGGDRVSVAYLDDRGVPHFQQDTGGRFLAMSDTQVLMDCSRK